MVTTTTIKLGWSGKSDSTLETAYNENIVDRANAVLCETGYSECSFDSGSTCSLNVIVNVEDVGVVGKVIRRFRNAEQSGENMDEVRDELVHELMT